MSEALKETPQPATIQGDFHTKRKGDLMSGDVGIILNRLDRLDSKIDAISDDMKDGAREFGGIEKVLDSQDIRIKSLEKKIWAVVWLCTVVVIGTLLKSILT